LPDENRNNPTGVANNIVDSLRGNPLVIGILALNAAFIVSFVYIDIQAKANYRFLTAELLRDCLTPLRNPQYVPRPQQQKSDFEKKVHLDKD